MNSTEELCCWTIKCLRPFKVRSDDFSPILLMNGSFSVVYPRIAHNILHKYVFLTNLKHNTTLIHKTDFDAMKFYLEVAIAGDTKAEKSDD